MLSNSHRRISPKKLPGAPKPSMSAPTSNQPIPDAWKLSEPSSPALSTSSFMSSVSWVAEKSAVELVTLLKNAYTVLRDKEKDLTLAAEIGRSLLENNMSLKSKYEALLGQVQTYQQEIVLDRREARRGELIFGNTTPDPRNDAASSQSKGDRGTETTDDDTMHFVSHQHSRQAIIESLERKNVEIQTMLEQALSENASAGQINDRKTRQLETEIVWLRTNLEEATTRIEELKENQHNRQERIRRHDEREFEQQITEDQALLEDLTEKVSGLLTDNEHLASSKKAVEEKLACAVHDLGQLRSQFEQFQFNQQGYSLLQEAYQRQFKHIAELNESLEEHRQVLSRLRDRGIWSARQSPSVSDYGAAKTRVVPSTTMSSTTLRDPDHHQKQSLLGELENAWQQKKCAPQTPHLSTNDIWPVLQESQSETLSSASIHNRVEPPRPRLRSASSFAKLRDLATMTERNLTSFCSAPGNYAMEAFLTSAGITDRSILDESISFLAQSENIDEDGQERHTFIFDDIEMFGPDGTGSLYDAMDLYPHLCDMTFSSADTLDSDESEQGIVSRIKHLLRCIFRSVWRWCRFAMVLATAVLINLWQGPDAMLERGDMK
ncbi:hypothetical protein J3Q64DRAFT_1341311 [Phycomyces blakesleeanus]|uniref:Uncharacterized protein n=1 Tax=Phycomyces blakesleeanus TaxID=4837 RepID=A0ABR3B7N5_PHYBL